MPLGIDLLPIWVDFGGQVGPQNPQKIDQKRHRKNDEKGRAFGNRFFKIFKGLAALRGGERFGAPRVSGPLMSTKYEVLEVPRGTRILEY